MGIEFNMDFDADEFKSAFADQAEELVKEWLETEAQEGKFNCDCGSTSFDIETWESNDGEIMAAGICVECNERMNIDVDTSEIDKLR